MHELTCPYCGSGVEYTSAAKVYKREGFGFLYLCLSYPACDSYASVGTDSRPVGTLANKDLRELRKRLYEVISKISADLNVSRSEINTVIARFQGKKKFLITDLRESDINDIFTDITGFTTKINEGLTPSSDASTQELKLPLRYLFVDSNSRPGGALPYNSYRGHLKILNESVKCGLVIKVTKQGTRKIFFVLSQAGKTLIELNTQQVRYRF